MANGQVISPILTDNASVEELNPNGAGVLNQLPSLKQTGEVQRDTITRFNDYKDIDNQRYSVTHPNALSDGDEHGKGDNNNQVGGLTDIRTKNTLLYQSGNKFKPNKGYYGYDYPEQYW
jgi:hypothetical protein